jgi:hypothetical protein
VAVLLKAVSSTTSSHSRAVARAASRASVTYIRDDQETQRATTTASNIKKKKIHSFQSADRCVRTKTAFLFIFLGVDIATLDTSLSDKKKQQC